MVTWEVRFLICFLIVGSMVFGRVGVGSKGASKMVLEYFYSFEYNHGHAHGQKDSSINLDKIGKFHHRQPNIMYFEELKLAVSLAVLPSTESLCDRHPHCSLLITIYYYGQKKNYNVIFIPWSDGNGIKIWRVKSLYVINFMARHIYKSKNIIEHTSLRSLRFSTTIDTKVYYQTSKTVC